jgi:outer membrane receptor for ferric coprogen and ferric-rhodotorulic acid
VVYGLTDEVSLYGSYTRIFNPQKEIDIDRRLLAPIQGSNLEAGVKSEWLDKRLAASFAVYRARQNHTAEAVDVFPDNTVYYRGVDATSTGFEAEVSGRPVPGWELSAGYSQLRLQDENGEDARTFVPRRALRMATSYQLPAAPSFRLGASLRWQSDTHTTDEGRVISQKGYALLDLMARHDFSHHLHLRFNVNNVTNQKYLNSLYWKWAYYGAPRNVSATLHWSY